MAEQGNPMEQELDSPAPDPDQAGLEVDWESLAVAVENQLANAFSFLHRVTGQVITVQATDGRDAEPPDAPESWLAVPARASREGYRTMQRFVEQLPAGDLKNKLTAALVGRGAFRRFKDQLLGAPEQRQEWFTFKDAEVYSYIADWLEREGIAIRNPAPGNSSRSRFSAAVRRSSPALPPMGEVAAGPAAEAERQIDWRAAIAPYDRPDRIYRPGRAALLIVDLQRVFVDPQGSSFLPFAPAACERLLPLVEAFRRVDRPVIFTRHVHRDPRLDGGAMGRWWRSLILEGSPDAELAGPVGPIEGERVITKSRYSAFAFTDLEMVLRSLQVEDLVIGGVMTNLCCETTARDGFVRDFNVFLLGDGTASSDPSLHLASLRNIAYGFGRVMSVADALRVQAGEDNSGSTRGGRT